MVFVSHPYMTTGKTIALTRQTFVGKTMSLLFSTSALRLNVSEFGRELKGLVCRKGSPGGRLPGLIFLLSKEFSRDFSNTTVFQICWYIECSTFTASSFRIRNSSAEIPLPPLALFVVILPKAHLTFHSRMFWFYMSSHIIVLIWVIKIFFV